MTNRADAWRENRWMIVPLALASVMMASAGCEVAPLQVTGLSDEHRRAPIDPPRVPAPDPAAVELPGGFRAQVVVADLTYPSSIEFDDSGNMYIAESGYVYGDHAAIPRILRVSSDGDIEVLTDRLIAPVTDLLWHNGELYVSHKTKISIVDSSGAVRDLVTDLPSLGDHHNNQLTAGPDGKIYFGQGVATNSGVVGIDNFVFGWLSLYPDVHDIPARDIRLRNEEFITLNPFVFASKDAPMVRTQPFAPFATEREGDTVRGRLKANGTILRMNADGSNLEVYAWGLRNPFGVMWSQDGNLYAADNGFDDRGSRPIAHAPDCIWRIRQGAWYGWPDFAGGIPVTDERFRPEGKPQPEFLMAEHPPVEKPIATIDHHQGVTKMDFSTSAEFGYEGQMFLAEVGDMTPITGAHQQPRGFQVVRVDVNAGRVEPFFRAKRSALGPRNLEYTVTAGPRRPVDVRFARDGREMYVVDIGAITVMPTIVPSVQPHPGTGVIWRIVREASDQENREDVRAARDQRDRQPLSAAGIDLPRLGEGGTDGWRD